MFAFRSLQSLYSLRINFTPALPVSPVARRHIILDIISYSARIIFANG